MRFQMWDVGGSLPAGFQALSIDAAAGGRSRNAARIRRTCGRLLVTAALITVPVAAQGDAEMASGPPRNLKGGKFQNLVDSMWRDSDTFRRQCLRVAGAPTLRITITADVMRPPSHARAATSIVWHRGVLVAADIVLYSLADSVELIAHEVEHIVEQLDGVKLRSNACEGSTSPSGFYESCRALEAGRRVAREVREAETSRTTNRKRAETTHASCASVSRASAASKDWCRTGRLVWSIPDVFPSPSPPAA